MLGGAVQGLAEGSWVLGQTDLKTIHKGTINIYTDSIESYVRQENGGIYDEDLFRHTFEITVLHEFGHVRGLADFPLGQSSAGRENSIMRYPTGTEQWWTGFRESIVPQLVDYVGVLHPEA